MDKETSSLYKNKKKQLSTRRCQVYWNTRLQLPNEFNGGEMKLERIQFQNIVGHTSNKQNLVNMEVE